jgi:hypothetical protein
VSPVARSRPTKPGVGKLVVVAVLVIAAVAAADGVRRASSERAATQGPEARTEPVARLVAGHPRGFVAVSDGLTRTRVVRAGEEVLGEQAIDAAFPAPLEGVHFDVAHVAVAPDGTLVLAIYKFPRPGRVQAGIELWRGKRLVGAFPVPAGSFGRGIGFDEGGDLVATFSRGDRKATLFDRAGRRAASLRLG